MSRYMNVKVNVSEGQKDKIKRALQAGTGVTIRLSHGDLSGEHVLALKQSQINKIAKLYQNRTGMALKISKTQLEHNAKVEGGFIGAILPFLATAENFLLSSVLPGLATGALTGIGSAAASKVVDKISGSGVVYMYVKKGGRNYKIVRHGEGLYLKPWLGSGIEGNGLYMKTGKGLYNVHENRQRHFTRAEFTISKHSTSRAFAVKNYIIKNANSQNGIY